MGEWTPIINDKYLKKRVEDKIYEILQVVKTTNSDNIGLINGECGIILSILYYSKYFNDTNIHEFASSRLEKLFDDLQGMTYVNSSYSSGVSGILSFLIHIKNNNILNIDRSIIDNLHDTYISIVLAHIEKCDYDFLHGFIGLAMPFMLLPNNKIIETIVEKLDREKLESKPGHFYWISKKKEIKVDLGLAHGIPSIIVFLSKIIGLNYFSAIAKKSKHLLKGAIKYLLSSKLEKNEFNTIFPGGIKNGIRTPINSRLAWCYGDLGIGMSLWVAGKNISSESLKKLAVNILMETVNRRDVGSTAIIDAMFCHGSAGAAHLYNRIFQETGNAIFKDCSKYWIQDVLSKSEFTNGLVGYKAYYGKWGWSNQAGILEGISGILLVLLSANYTLEPKWDELFLIS